MTSPDLRFFDTHMHSESIKIKAPELLESLKSAIVNQSIAQCIDIGINPRDYLSRIPLLQTLGIAWYTVGLYPSHAKSDNWPQDLAELETHISNSLTPISPKTAITPVNFPRLIGIGEIGIDLYRDYADVLSQQELFRAQIELANQYNLPIIVHNRNADREILECIRACPPRRGGILHCFSSTFECASALIDFGFRVSFAGNLTYRSSENLRQVAQRLDLKDILLETDSPYLSPEPFRGKPNWPGQVRATYDLLADIKKISLEELCSQIEVNLDKFLNLD